MLIWQRKAASELPPKPQPILTCGEIPLFIYPWTWALHARKLQVQSRLQPCLTTFSFPRCQLKGSIRSHRQGLKHYRFEVKGSKIGCLDGGNEQGGIWSRVFGFGSSHGVSIAVPSHPTRRYKVPGVMMVTYILVRNSTEFPVVRVPSAQAEIVLEEYGDVQGGPLLHGPRQ